MGFCLPAIAGTCESVRADSQQRGDFREIVGAPIESK